MMALLVFALAVGSATGLPAQPPVSAPAPDSAAPAPESPETASQPRPPDARIRVVPYVPNSIVELKAALGYQLMIEFGPDERIENVAIGDSLGWQITPNRKANLLFVKPMDKVPLTNMTVVTNLRTYLFEMIPVAPPAHRGERSVMYALQFSYPPEKTQAAEAKPSAPPPPQIVNSAYSYTGSTKILPTRIFDDGHATYFQFREGEDYPAIFTVDHDKGEAVVNSSIRGGYVVVDEISRGFTLRQGNDVTRIFNDGFHEPQPGPLSPVPRKETCSNWICP